MSYIDRNLTPGETVIYETRLHWIVMLRSVVLACVLFVLGAFLFYYVHSNASLDPGTGHSLEIVAAISLIAAIFAILVGAARRNATEMAVTTHRVIIKLGLVSRRTMEMMLSKVETIEVTEPAFGRMLGYGTIVVIGSGGSLEPFQRIANPLRFRTAVQQQIEKLS